MTGPLDEQVRLRALWRQAEGGQLEDARRAAATWRAQGNAPPGVDLLLGQIALSQDQPAQAAAFYRACLRDPAAPPGPAHMGLAAALSAQGDQSAAIEVLQALLGLAPEHFLARLRLAELLEQQGQWAPALHAYYAAVVHAQHQGRWLADDSTVPALRPRVRHAMEQIEQGRHRLFLSLLAPLQHRYGIDALARVERGLRIYLGELPAHYANPAQQPTFFYVPDVPATPYLARDLFPWLEALEAATDGIRGEMLATRELDGAYSPFLGAPVDALPPGLLAGQSGQAAWEAYFFFRHGRADEAHARQCPLTHAVLERTPLVRIRDHAPEICFSVLAPGAHILPHRGVTNTRLTAHLPLIVPGNCALLAGGELHAWEEGRAVVFDDTFLHEAWNRSGHPRVILLMDTWNPHLTPIEREAVTCLVEAIGDFNASAGAA